ncbi:hypothetical protein ADK66_04095, partial [Micromonospora sp. NRRL B-16802]
MLGSTPASVEIGAGVLWRGSNTTSKDERWIPPFSTDQGSRYILGAGSRSPGMAVIVNAVLGADAALTAITMAGLQLPDLKMEREYWSAEEVPALPMLHT